MARSARIIALKQPHLVYQPTLNNRAIFYTKTDYEAYLEILRDSAEAHKLDILAYCLLKNGIYLLVRPQNKTALSKGLGRAHFSYRHYLSERRGKKEELWRNRIQSCPVEGRNALAAAQFVECQAVWRKHVRAAHAYAWSSAGSHLNGRDGLGILAKDWPDGRQRSRWGDVLTRSTDAAARRQIQQRIQTGRPWGSGAFIASLEKKYKCRLTARPVGRPRNT